MHAYSTDESRVRTYSVLAVLSVVLAWAIVALTSLLKWPQWLVSAPAMGGVFATLYSAFDRYAWRWPICRRLGLVDVRDVSGTYDGALISTWKQDGKQVEREVTFVVVQTWTTICVEMTVAAETSTSFSTSALAAITHDGAATGLTYIYKNSVNPGVADEDMSDHDGAAALRIYDDGRVTGRYFNGRPRAGTISARRRAD